MPAFMVSRFRLGAGRAPNTEVCSLDFQIILYTKLKHDDSNELRKSTYTFIF